MDKITNDLNKTNLTQSNLYLTYAKPIPNLTQPNLTQFNLT